MTLSLNSPLSPTVCGLEVGVLGAADGFVRGGEGKAAGFWGWWGDLASKGRKLRG